MEGQEIKGRLGEKFMAGVRRGKEETLERIGGKEKPG